MLDTIEKKRKKKLQQIATYSSICETLSVPNFHGAGKSSFEAFVKSKLLSQRDFRTTRTTSPKYLPLMYFSNLEIGHKKVFFFFIFTFSIKMLFAEAE